ncbi:MAG: MarR family transcriptional regulator [Pseudomonadota bacterium]
MTEIKAEAMRMPDAVERFVVHWGEMGATWGVNRSVSQIHALLYLSEAPLTAEDIADRLSMARSNVSNSLKELMSWNLIRRVHTIGDRRDRFEAEADLYEMVRRIAEGRKAREIDPTLAALRVCVSEANTDPSVSEPARERLSSMLGFLETVDKSFTELVRLPSPTLIKLLRMGGTLAKVVGGRGAARDS